MLFLKWLRKRLIFLKRQLIEFYHSSIYQKQSHFILHRHNAHRCQYQSMLYYNAMGRFLFMLRETLALVTRDKLFKRSIQIDGFESIDYKNLYQQGSHEILYPKSPMIQVDEVKIEENYYNKIANSFLLAYQHDNENKDISNEWDRISKEFREIFFDDNHKIIKERLENFRGDPAIYSKIFNNQYPYITTEQGYTKSYLDAIDLVLEYHRFAQKIDKEVLASVSESEAGGYRSINYRGKKLSEQLLQNLVVANDIVKYVPISYEKKALAVDIGVGFGGSSRILNYYRPNMTQILIDLPETLFLTAYYLKYNFPHKKIALLEDIYPHLDNLDEVLLEYDFIIVPPFILDYLNENSIDLVINASSLAFMSEEYLEYYLKMNKRLLKQGGYFYSLNTSENNEWGTGSHHWDYQTDYLTIYQNFDNRFAYPQWIGQKL